MRKILGVDPGINGSVALYCDGAVSPTVPGGIFDIPTVGDGKRREIDYVRLRDMVWALRPDVAWIEQVNAFVPKKKDGDQEDPFVLGNTSMFKFGGAYYAIRAVISCLDIPLRTVTPAEWKAAFSLRGGKAKKDDARQLVIQRYPSVVPFMKRKLDGNRADAFLVAVYASRKMRREGENLDIPE